MRRLTKRQTFWLLMLLSAAGMWLPGSATDPAKHAVAVVLSPLTDWLGRSAISTRRFVHGIIAGPPPNSTLEADEARRLADLVQLQRLHEQLLDVTGMRAMSAGPGSPKRWSDVMGVPGLLLPARVVMRDASGLRDSIIISKGASDGLRVNQRVCARVPGRGASFDIRDTVLVGQVRSTGPVTAQVMLLSDAASKLAGQVYDPDAARLGPECPLIEGLGDGKLIARKVAGPNGPPAKVGDWVFSADDDQRLPAQVLIGRVVKVAPDKIPVEYVLEISAPVNYTNLLNVYVIDPAGRTYSETK